MKEITFVRHGRSEANEAGVWNGRGDSPLSAEGEQQLGALGPRLARVGFDVVVSSPLERARRTAESFADEVVIDDEFLELDLGRWEGLTGAEVT
ncbi:MAG: histidine phosphatase family protein, partial [Acidimicrobiia bacterium]|nr:histidine phosphatase family protein [Acidimicrobiia bacterium]